MFKAKEALGMFCFAVSFFYNLSFLLFPAALLSHAKSGITRQSRFSTSLFLNCDISALCFLSFASIKGLKMKPSILKFLKRAFWHKTSFLCIYIHYQHFNVFFKLLFNTSSKHKNSLSEWKEVTLTVAPSTEKRIKVPGLPEQDLLIKEICRNFFLQCEYFYFSHHQGGFNLHPWKIFS